MIWSVDEYQYSAPSPLRLVGDVHRFEAELEGETLHHGSRSMKRLVAWNTITPSGLMCLR